MSIRRPLAVLAGAATLATLLGVTVPTATAAPTWAPVEEAAITPGAQTFTAGAQCTANFVFTDGTDVYLGQAAHCSGLGAADETDGCLAGSLPLGTPVEVAGASRPGTLAYSSWIAMQEAGETDADACAHNDFALVRLDPADHDEVNPSLPVWGGPVGLGDETDLAEPVYSYGSSRLRLGLTALSPKIGLSLGSTAGGWTHRLYTLTPGIPGDSGSGFLDRDGNAIGVLSTLVIAPLTGSNQVSDLARALAYARDVAGVDVDLVPGTEPFSLRR